MTSLSILRGAFAGCLMLLILAPGCGDNQAASRPATQPSTTTAPVKDAVRFLTTTTDGRECLIPMLVEVFMPPANLVGNQDTLLATPGTMLGVIHPESKPATRSTTQPDTVANFLYIYRGDEEQPLAFVAEKCCAILNGKAVYLDLTAPGASQWLRAQPAAGLKTIRSLTLGDDRDLNLDALRKLAGHNLLLDIKTDIDVAHDKDLADAIVAAAPAGLVSMNQPRPGLENLVPRLTHLTHLAVSPCDPAKLRDLPDLQFLLLHVKESTGTTTKPAGQDESSPDPARVAEIVTGVSQLTQLRSLRLGSCEDVTDFTPLGKLTALRSLSLDEGRNLISFEAIAPLTHLQSLAVVGADRLESLSGIEKFGDLEKLAIIDHYCPVSLSGT